MGINTTSHCRVVDAGITSSYSNTLLQWYQYYYPPVRAAAWLCRLWVWWVYTDCCPISGCGCCRNREWLTVTCNHQEYSTQWPPVYVWLPSATCQYGKVSMVMAVCSLTRGPILMLLQLTKSYKEEHSCSIFVSINCDILTGKFFVLLWLNYIPRTPIGRTTHVVYIHAHLREWSHIHEFFAFLVEWPQNFKVENLLQFHAIL